MQKKLESALKTLEQAQKANEAHQADIRKLEEELRQVEEQKATWEQSVLGTTTKRPDVHLEEAQVILIPINMAYSPLRYINL